MKDIFLNKINLFKQSLSQQSRSVNLNICRAELIFQFSSTFYRGMTPFTREHPTPAPFLRTSTFQKILYPSPIPLRTHLYSVRCSTTLHIFSIHTMSNWRQQFSYAFLDGKVVLNFSKVLII